MSSTADKDVSINCWKMNRASRKVVSRGGNEDAAEM
jgi:hypothetical protein